MNNLHDEAVRLIERLSEHQSGDSPVRCAIGGITHDPLEPHLTSCGVVLRCVQCGRATTELPTDLHRKPFHPEIGRAQRDIAQRRPPC